MRGAEANDTCTKERRTPEIGRGPREPRADVLLLLERELRAARWRPGGYVPFDSRFKAPPDLGGAVP